MSFDPERAEIRFGCGLSPRIAPPVSVDDMMARLTGPDRIAAALPIPDYDAYRPRMSEVHAIKKVQKNGRTEDERQAAYKTYIKLRRKTRADAAGWMGQMMLRRALTEDGLRERLVSFWADHFTARGNGRIWPQGQLPYIEQAIRPHVSGRFGDMLRAAALHPLMVKYLDQSKSIGPNSAVARKQGKRAGLNENLAREMLELHTLGVEGPYEQADVQALARILTGVTFKLKHGFVYAKKQAEPGPHVLLGHRFGAKKPKLKHIHDALDMLATHPATAGHIAHKMAVHFVSDTPDPGMVADMTVAFSATNGDLAAVTRVMLEHPAAWADGPRNVKRPIDFIGSAMRALDVVPRQVPTKKPKDMRALILAPLTLMGQPLEAPPGPDGWPESDADWITPQRLAARLQWAMAAPYRLTKVLPRPEDFARAALGGTLPEPVRFAAASAETRAEGIGLVLASPAFQRV
ncbi:DUF1800 domain-containing protein [Rhodobacteraceae bacterium KMM 6894]|nr:DUF1800 domain-containing protein [Rhodobacteraceae bacterium KMM 6894]